MSPGAAYRRLLGCFGPQGWWPLTPPGAWRPRYHPGRFGRAHPREAAEICLGAVLTQNTAWSNVEKALESLHRAGAADFGAVLRMPPRRLERLIRPSGFFVQKARKLKDFARALTGLELIHWLRSPLCGLREDLLAIRGVGPETADSILLYAGARPVFVVDAYSRRIANRLGWFGANLPYDAVASYFTARLPRSPYVYQEFHALLVALAKRHCTKRDPLCAACPLLSGCPEGRRRVRRGAHGRA